MTENQSCIRLLASILDKLDNLPSGPFWVRDVLEKKYPFPISLQVGDGQAIYITPEINRMLALFSKAVMDVFFDSQKSEFTDSEWDQMVKRAFGTALVDCREENRLEEDATAILTSVRETVEDWIREIQPREYAFGCHLSKIPDLEPLSIGTVRFEPRRAWLARMHGSGCVSDIMRSRIERVWEGKHLRKRRPSEDASRESAILGTIGESHFVCSIAVGPMGAEAGLQKALIAARLATTTLALAWVRPSSTLDFMTLTYDRQPHLRWYVGSSTGGRFGWGSSWSYLPGGERSLEAEDWGSLRSDLGKLFDSAGEAVRYVTHGPNEVSRPEMTKAFFQALLWFHEGCREDVDSMAIVKFCSSMEALARGKKSRGILDLMKARLRVRDEDKLRKDLKRLYETGRSQTVHGTNYRLGHDWSDSRSLSEELARICLISCLHWAAEHQQENDPRLLSQSKT